MEQELIDTDHKQPVQKRTLLNRIILFYNLICLISTVIYWRYFESTVNQTVTPGHFKFRRFIYENYVREIILITLSIGILYAVFYALTRKKIGLLLISLLVLLLEILLFNQLHLSEG